MKILTQNSKLKKDPRFLVYGLDLAPAKTSGFNTCKHAGVCAEICIGLHSGFNKLTTSRKAKIRRTHLFFKDRDQFLKLVHADLAKLDKLNTVKEKFVRLNVDSDLPWERIDPTLFDYPNIKFYDYTKYIERAFKQFDNYELTYSYNERSDSKLVAKLLKSSKNICVVANMGLDIESTTAIIRRQRYDIVDGDLSDIRHSSIDGTSKVIIVRPKMRQNQIQEYIKKGFVIDVNKNKLQLS